ncbi:hypothetical protein CEXT_353031 [Caerostris extrusa]|uniref:Uncharacterized protein n=1 Tax=Caerostris extrusa TaxID=172846 RepID=A0AAV4Q0Z8_CAEEX|nr:hypothetical protein CEXT_353031 [Caerostris extrusa]
MQILSGFEDSQQPISGRLNTRCHFVPHRLWLKHISPGRRVKKAIPRKSKGDTSLCYLEGRDTGGVFSHQALLRHFTMLRASGDRFIWTSLARLRLLGFVALGQEKK